MFGFFQAIEFLQDDNKLVLEGPDVRRRFFDIACSLANPAYYRVLLNYNRALRQRNVQLKDDLVRHGFERSIWNATVVQSGLVLMEARARMAETLLEHARQRLAAMPGCSIDFSLRYMPNVRAGGGLPDAETYRLVLEKSRGREEIFRTTVVGPHRDGFDFFDRGRSMRDYSSQGQIRLAVIALKLALVRLLEETGGTKPVLLFDDILLEIDIPTTESILETFGSSHQLFFTSTVVPGLDFFRRLPESFFFAMERT